MREESGGGDKIVNKETAPKEPNDTSPNDPHEVTDREDEDSANERAVTESRIKEGDRHKSVARMEKQTKNKKKAEIRKKEMKARSKEDNHVNERGTQGGDRKENNLTGSNESKTTRQKGRVPVSSIPHGRRKNNHGR